VSKISFEPQPKQKPKRLPRRKPLKTVPSGIGDEDLVANYLFYYLKGGDHLHDFCLNNHGTIIDATWIDGSYGWALSFDGVDDTVKIPHTVNISFDETESFTYVFWLKSTSTSGRFFWKENNPYNVGNEFRIYDGADVGGVNLTGAFDGLWHFCVAVVNRDADMMYGYVDGDQVDSDDISAVGDCSNTYDLWVASKNNTDLYWDGNFAWLCIYNIPLSQTWIRQRFARTKSIFK